MDIDEEFELEHLLFFEERKCKSLWKSKKFN